MLVTAPTHSRVRESAVSAYATQLNLSPVGGTLATTIQAAFSPSVGGVCNEDVLFSSGGCGDQSINLTADTTSATKYFYRICANSGD